MSLIHDLSSQTPLPGYDLFAVPPTQTTVEKDIVTEHRPLSTLQSNQPIEFNIPTAIDEYISPREMILYLRMHVEIATKDKTDVTPTLWDKVTPVNNLFHALFESIDVFIGDAQVNSSNSTYPYLAYFDTLLNVDKDALKTYMTAGLFYEHDYDRRPFIKTVATSNTNANIGKSVELAGKLVLDLFNQEKSILGGSTIRIRLTPHSPAFYLNISSTNIQATVKFEECFLEVHRSKLYEPVVSAHNEALKIANAKYPICRREVKQFTCPKGSLDIFIDNALTGVMPDRAFLVAVSNAGFHGAYDEDPFKFENNGINYVVMHLNSRQFPQKAYKPDFPNDKFMREYLGLYEAANQLYGRTNINISRTEWKDGKTIFGFNFAPDLSEDCNTTGYTNLIKRGNLRIEIHFKEKLAKTINLLLYVEYDNVIEIGPERNGIVNLQ